MIALKLNYDLSLEYATLKGKTQALGLRELKNIDRYYYGIIGLAALIFSYFAKMRKEPQTITGISLFLAVMSIFLTFYDTWTLF
jgi:hypothetical protein